MRFGRTAARSLAAVVLAASVSCLSAAAHKKLDVVASTTLLQSAVTDIGGRYVNVGVLIAPGSCPGHYDIRPQDMRKLSSSKLALIHGYEAFIEKLVDSMGRNRPKLVKIRVAGNWMVPDVYIRGAKQVTDALCAVDPKHSADYRRSFSLLEARTKKLSAEMSKELKAKAVSRVAILCSDQQKPFVEWMGFKVVGTYARAEEFTPAELHKLTALGRRQNVRLVIDNLQSGPTAGKELSKDIGAAHVTLSNFPGGFAGTDTWSACLRDNVRRVLKGMKR